MNRPFANTVIGAGLVVTLGIASPALAQTAPPLGSAQSFAVLGGSTVTNTGPSVVTGDLGVSPGSAVDGFPPGLVVGGTIHADDATALAAQNSVITAYDNLSGQACTSDLTGQDLGGMTLTPGVYCFDTSAQLTGTLRLDAGGDPNAVFIFKIGSTLTTATNAVVTVISPGLNCNVFWQVGSSATLGINTAFVGNILALTSITLTTNASVFGRTLARNGAVTLDTNTVNAAACLVPAEPPGCPVLTLAPPTLPNGTIGVAYSQTITASGGTPPYTFAVTSGVPPPGLVLSIAGVLSGTPTTAGTYTFTVRATDSLGCFAEVTYTIVIVSAPGCPELTLAPPTLPGGTLGVAYSQTITASGGTPPYTFTVTSGTPPAGLELSAAGVLSGTPTTAGTYAFVVRGTDSLGCFAEVTYSITIPAAVPTLGQWGLIGLALLLTGAGVAMMRRRTT